jgi:hypothetical protein
MSPKKKPSMSASHKAALAQGRNESRSVRVYLEALEVNKPKRGRKRTVESVKKRLSAVKAELVSADPLKRVQLVQEQMDCEIELERFAAKQDLSELEADFVKAAKGYSERKGLSYAAWRQVGVEPAVLRKAGITRSE